MISKPACEYNEIEERAYHHALGQEHDEIMQYAGFTSVKWSILKIMQDWGVTLDYKMYCYLRELEWVIG